MPFAPGPLSANAGGAMKPNRSLLASVLLVCFSTGAAWSQNEGNQANCSGLPTAGQLKQFLATAPNDGGDAGGLFHGTLMWAAVVNRSGQLCAFATSTGDPTKVWPGSQAIAKAKAFTANAFSNDPLALSTARLYTFIQPGHSLYGLNNSNPFNPDFLAPPRGQGGGTGEVAGCIITFGGGVVLTSPGRRLLAVDGGFALLCRAVAARSAGCVLFFEAARGLMVVVGDDVVAGSTARARRCSRVIDDAGGVSRL